MCTAVVGRGGVDGAEHAAGRGLDDAHRLPAGAAQIDEVGRRARAGSRTIPPGRRRRSSALTRTLEQGSAAPGPNSSQVGLGQRQLGGGGARCGRQHVGVVGVEDRGLDRRGRRSPPGGGRGRCPAGRRGRRARRARPRRGGRPGRPAATTTTAGPASRRSGRRRARRRRCPARGRWWRPAPAAGPSRSARLRGAAAPPAGTRPGRRRPGPASPGSTSLEQAPGRGGHRLGAPPGGDEGQGAARRRRRGRPAARRSRRRAVRRVRRACSPPPGGSGGSQSTTCRSTPGERRRRRRPRSQSEPSRRGGVGGVRRRSPRRARRSGRRRTGPPTRRSRRSTARRASRRLRGSGGTRRPRRTAALRRNGAHRAWPGSRRVVQHVRVGQHQAGVVPDPASLVQRGVAVVGRRADAVQFQGLRPPCSWSAASALVGAR